MTKGQPSLKTDCQIQNQKLLYSPIPVSFCSKTDSNTPAENKTTHLLYVRLSLHSGPQPDVYGKAFWFDLKKKKKISSLSLKIHCLKSLRGIFAHDNLPYKWPVRDSQQCVCQSVKGGGIWGWDQLVFPLQLFTEDEKKTNPDLITVPWIAIS